MSDQLPYTAADVFHDSRLLTCRSPFGALPLGETVRLRLYLSERLRYAYCLLCLRLPEGERAILMEHHDAPDGAHYCEAELSLQSPGLALYWFTVNDGARLYYYGCQCGAGGAGALSADSVRPYQITLYDPAFTTPRWFTEGVAYHIFVDRFCRGEGLGGLARARFHEEKGRTIVKHADWNEQVLYTPVNGNLYYDPCDFFGGDLAGIRAKLPYLAALGVSCLYLSPIFESPSNHKYNTGDYLNIDPMFGTEEDLKALCEAAKGYGIRIVLDGVFSHTGDDSRYFNRFGRYETLGAAQSPDSPYYSWYSFFHYPDRYRCWWNFPSLPEVNEMDPAYVDFIATGEHSVLRRWQNAGVSGWRLDVADELPDEFIALLRKEVKRISPDALLLGEVWEDASQKFSMGHLRSYVNGAELDSVMNYPLRGIVLDYLTGKITAPAAADALSALRENYPPPFYYACLNLLSTHDVPRALTLLGGGPDKDSGLTREEQARFSLQPLALARAKARMRLAFALLFSLPGVPCIYYGDEAGMEGCMDPFNRAPFPWGREDAALQSRVAEWSRLRRRTDALTRGHAAFFAPDSELLLVLRFVANGEDALGQSAENGVYLLLVNRSKELRYLHADFPALLRQNGYTGGEVPRSAKLTKLLYEGGDSTAFNVLSGAAQLAVGPETCALYRFDA